MQICKSFPYVNKDGKLNKNFPNYNDKQKTVTRRTIFMNVWLKESELKKFCFYESLEKGKQKLKSFSHPMRFGPVSPPTSF